MCFKASFLNQLVAFSLAQLAKVFYKVFYPDQTNRVQSTTTLSLIWIWLEPKGTSKQQKKY